MDRIGKQCNNLINEINQQFSLDCIRTGDRKEDSEKKDARATNRILTCHGKLLTCNNANLSTCPPEVCFISHELCRGLSKINQFLTSGQDQNLLDNSHESSGTAVIPQKHFRKPNLKTEHLNPIDIKPILKIQTAFDINLKGENEIRKTNNVAVYEHKYIYKDEHDELEESYSNECSTVDFSDNAKEEISIMGSLRSYLFQNAIRCSTEKKRKPKKRKKKLKISKRRKKTVTFAENISEVNENRNKTEKYDDDNDDTKPETDNGPQILHKDFMMEFMEQDENTPDDSFLDNLTPEERLPENTSKSEEEIIRDMSDTNKRSESICFEEDERIKIPLGTKEKTDSSSLHVHVMEEEELNNFSSNPRNVRSEFKNSKINNRFQMNNRLENVNLTSYIDLNNFSRKTENLPMNSKEVCKQNFGDNSSISAFPLTCKEFLTKITSAPETSSSSVQKNWEGQHEKYVKLLSNIISNFQTTSKSNATKDNVKMITKNESTSNSDTTTCNSSISFGEIPRQEHLSPGEIRTRVALEKLSISSSSSM